MPSVPFPLSGNTVEDIRPQLYELVRSLFEDHIGGADLGDVFSIPGDVLTLVLANNSGLTKSGRMLSVTLSPPSGLYLWANGLAIQLVSTGGLDVSAAGLGAKIKPGGGLASDINGLYTTVSGAGTPASVVVDETTWGLPPIIGVSMDYARGDHSHGSPADPGSASVSMAKQYYFGSF